MKQMKIGIIGCGVIATNHLWAIENISNCEVYALCDSNQSAMDELNKKIDHEVQLYQSLDELLENAQVDAVAICLPHHLHRDAFIASLKANKHVICEKPAGINFEQLQEMEAEATSALRRGIFSSGIFQHRFSPLVNHLLSLIKNNSFGTLESASLYFRCTRAPEYYASAEWRGKWESEGGGLLINQAIHTFDLLREILGMPEGAEFKLERNHVESIEVEDKGEGILFYSKSSLSKGECKLSLENDLETEWNPRINVRGSKASFTLIGSDEINCSDPSLQKEFQNLTSDEAEDGPGKSCYGSLHLENWQDFVKGVEQTIKGEPTLPRVSIHTWCQSCSLVLGLYQSHFQNKKINYPTNEWIQTNKISFKEQLS